MSCLWPSWPSGSRSTPTSSQPLKKALVDGVGRYLRPGRPNHSRPSSEEQEQRRLGLLACTSRSASSRWSRDFLKEKVRSMTPVPRRELTDRRHAAPVHSAAVPADGLSADSSLYYRPKGTPPGDLSLMQAMDRQYLQTPFYGSRRMQASLDRQVFTVSRKRVQRALETDRTEGYLPAASHQPTSGRTLGLSLPAEGSDDHPG